MSQPGPTLSAVTAVDTARTRTLALAGPLDLRRTFKVSGLKGPTLRVAEGGLWRTTRTPQGPATIRLSIDAGNLRADVWGRGADWVLERLPEMVGEHDDRDGLVAHHEAVADILHRGRGLRLPRVGRMVEVLIPVIIAQKVTGVAAGRSYRELVRRHGERAPGPLPMWLPPDPDRLAGLPYYEFHPLGIERRRADTIRRVCREGRRLEATIDLAIGPARRVLLGVQGIGPWTVARAMLVVRGDPDAVPLGDYHIPSIVSWALAREPRGTDERMLELLEPYRGQRGRVVRLLESYGEMAPRYGPKLAAREFRTH